jgi:hypothetical protein
LNWLRIPLLDGDKQACFGKQALKDAELAQLAKEFFQDMKNL